MFWPSWATRQKYYSCVLLQLRISLGIVVIIHISDFTKNEFIIAPANLSGRNALHYINLGADTIRM